MKKDQVKNAEKMGQVDHPERRYNSQRNKTRDLNESPKRENKQPE